MQADQPSIVCRLHSPNRCGHNSSHKRDREQFLPNCSHTVCHTFQIIKEAIFSNFLQTLHQKLSTLPTLADQELMDHNLLKIHFWNKKNLQWRSSIQYLSFIVLEQGTNLGKGECVCVHVLRRTIYWGIISITHLSTLPCHIMLYHQWWSIVQTSKQSSHTSSQMILLFCHCEQVNAISLLQEPSNATIQVVFVLILRYTGSVLNQHCWW